MPPDNPDTCLVSFKAFSEKNIADQKYFQRLTRFKPGIEDLIKDEAKANQLKG